MIICSLCKCIIVPSSEKKRMTHVQLAFKIGAAAGVQLLHHRILMTRVQNVLALSMIPRKSHRVKRQEKFITGHESEMVA
jgi:hypothetical protein